MIANILALLILSIVLWMLFKILILDHLRLIGIKTDFVLSSFYKLIIWSLKIVWFLIKNLILFPLKHCFLVIVRTIRYFLSKRRQAAK